MGGGYVGGKAYSALKSPLSSTHWWQVSFAQAEECVALLGCSLGGLPRPHCRAISHRCAPLSTDATATNK